MLFEGYKITSHFGNRLDPFTKKSVFHSGIDLVKKDKAPIHAFLGGKVLHAKEGAVGSGFGGFGNVVAILDDFGAFHVYAHLNACKVKVGDKVAQGDVIGLQGSTGRSTGSHLHYEVRKTYRPSNGWRSGTKHVYDPAEYLKKHL